MFSAEPTQLNTGDATMTVLFVIATILVFLTIDWFVQRSRVKHEVPELAPRPVQTHPVRLPDGIFFAPSHTWLNLFPSGKVRLGIDDFVARLFENPELSFIKKPGEEIRRGDPLLLVKDAGHTLTIHAPITGTIVAMNDALVQNPDVLKDRLFSDGWGYVIQPRRADELKGLLLGSETKRWMQEEFRRLRDFFAGLDQGTNVAPALLQDGGPPVAGIMSTMNEKVWSSFEEQFLKSV
jgi:glycine cleavage system H protein